MNLKLLYRDLSWEGYLNKPNDLFLLIWIWTINTLNDATGINKRILAEILHKRQYEIGHFKKK